MSVDEQKRHTRLGRKRHRGFLSVTQEEASRRDTSDVDLRRCDGSRLIKRGWSSVLSAGCPSHLILLFFFLLSLFVEPVALSWMAAQFTTKSLVWVGCIFKSSSFPITSVAFLYSFISFL